MSAKQVCLAGKRRGSTARECSVTPAGSIRRIAFFLTVAVALGISGLPNTAQATVNAALAEACHSGQEPDRVLCAQYVAGFLDGALLTDAAVVNNLSSGERSDFMERAYRTRVGEGRTPLPPTALADFCLPDGLSSDAAAGRVVDALGQKPVTTQSLQDEVYSAVKALFPCEG